MDENKDTTFSFGSSELIEFVIKYFKHLAIITFAGAAISVIVALTIQPRFKSKVVLFPASSSSISNDLLSQNSGRKDILKFGNEDEVEQMLQILYSDEIRDEILTNYNLMNHYEIDSLGAFPLTKLHKKFSENISFRRTQYMSIEIEVLDTDPQTAADIANNIAALIDTAMNRMKKERALLAMQLVEKEYSNLEDDMQLTKDSLKKIQEKGINNYESQAEVFNDAYAQAIAKGNARAIRELKSKLDTLSKYGVAYTSLRNKLIYDTERYSNLIAKYIEAKVDYEQSLPHKFIVDRAVKAEKKSKPIRWLIVVLSTFGSFIFAFLLILAIVSFGRIAKVYKKQSDSMSAS